MHPECYTDGVDEITVSGSIVRVDLVTLSPTERDANNAPKRVLCQRLIFSVEAFANSVDVMQKALQGLADAGVVRRNPAELKASASPPSAVSGKAPAELSLVNTKEARADNVSVNFR
jgi:hypothetical protein